MERQQARRNTLKLITDYDVSAGGVDRQDVNVNLTSSIDNFFVFYLVRQCCQRKFKDSTTRIKLRGRSIRFSSTYYIGEYGEIIRKTFQQCMGFVLLVSSTLLPAMFSKGSALKGAPLRHLYIRLAVVSPRTHHCTGRKARTATSCTNKS